MTNSSSLTDALVRAAPPNVLRLPPELGAWWIGEFRDRYVENPSVSWWWDALAVPTRAIQYGDADGLALIEDTVRDWGPLALVVTNEQPEPVACFLGLAKDLVAAIREVVNFEFILCSIDLNRWVFDTHDNVFLVFDET
jgi:hypothetical protein